MSYVYNFNQTFSLRNLSQILATMFAVTYPDGRQGDEITTPSPWEFQKVTDPYMATTHSQKQRIPSDTLAYIGGERCTNVKKLLGVLYDQIQIENEPDLSQLRLHFKSPSESRLFSLETLANEIPTLGLNGTKPLIVFLHGFTDDPAYVSLNMINDALQSIEHSNILAVDASPLFRWQYLRSSTYVRFIGAKLGEALAAIYKQGLSRKRIHLIGHSVGAHIAGYAGDRFKKLTGKKLARVTGLDPAGPCFADLDKKYMLSHNNAKFVDVIHTNAGVFGLAKYSLVGHADFFPNGGRQQPSSFCPTCSHSRVVQLYLESITDENAFFGVKCSNEDQWKQNKCSKTTKVMGHGASSMTRGRYYLRTNNDAPFGLEMSGVVYKKKEFLFRAHEDNFKHVK